MKQVAGHAPLTLLPLAPVSTERERALLLLLHNESRSHRLLSPPLHMREQKMASLLVHGVVLAS